VSYQFEYSDTGASLNFQLSDNPQLVPARFENFVWFSDAELMDQLHRRVPLFRGQLPLNGNLPDLVSDALQAMLIERKVAGKADYLRSGQQDGPITSILYSVEGLHIVIRNAGFSGAPEAELKRLQQASKALYGKEYLRSAIQPMVDKDLLPVFLSRGYLKAKFGPPEAKVVQETPEATSVDLNFPIEAGPQYNFAGAEWSGNKTFPAGSLDALLSLRDGQPANAVQLEEDLNSVRRLYGTKGFMGIAIKPISRLNETARTAVFQLQVEEGDVYHMGDLDVRGLDSPTTQRLKIAWRLAEGDVYDAGYPEAFLKNLGPKTINILQWDVETHENVDHREKTVDITFQFRPRPLN
jgi:outer membrane protein assembly factor BamA